MVNIKLKFNEKQKGAFFIYEAGAEIGEMIIDIAKNILTVYHTGVIPEAKGKGNAKQLVETMVAYVREHKLTVRPLCPYVLAQFRQDPDQYLDVWEQTGH
ncbi:GNAT family N-acetyltransferase [Spirosoma areae]